jgi:hypothetical protein
MVNGDDRYDTTIAEITATVRYLGLLSHKGEREAAAAFTVQLMLPASKKVS